MDELERNTDALKVARMYYYQNMTSEAISRELHVSRSTVSRLLAYAKAQGLVNIQIVDPGEHPSLLEQKIVERFGIKRAHVVPVSAQAGEGEWLTRVVQYAANYLNTSFDSDMIMGIAWGTTISSICKYLLPKATHNAQIIQLNGAGNTQSMGIEYASEIIVRFQSPPHLMFGLPLGNVLAPNTLALCIQPDEGILLQFELKVPDSVEETRSAAMEFRYCSAGEKLALPDAYERLLLDALHGDASLFTRSDEIEIAWQLIDPVVRGWEQPDVPPLVTYEPGSWGPAEADAFLARDGRVWRHECRAHPEECADRERNDA